MPSSSRSLPLTLGLAIAALAACSSAPPKQRVEPAVPSALTARPDLPEDIRVVVGQVDARLRQAWREPAWYLRRPPVTRPTSAARPSI